MNRDGHTEGSFGAAARRLAGAAARWLGWRPGEFWDATPAELAAAILPEDAGAGARPLRRDELRRLMERDDGEERRR